ncbi:unnamed protein product [Brugia pahangi]|uniref:Uncharacterized protein n=1 Tax=Brugia pahangi TaxID=6280 RepID=A0A0N4THP2_BRUPA|nr:unnamed protein product [Brugia pahangi]
MAKLLVYIAFIIYCGRQAANPVQPGPGVAAAEIITGSLIQTTQVEESTLLNCDRMEDGRVSILEEKPLLFVRNTLNLIK